MREEEGEKIRGEEKRGEESRGKRMFDQGSGQEKSHGPVESIELCVSTTDGWYVVDGIG